ncbi:hypothetical protein DERP_004799 [Dermatophagoides pteronyssinus]|uniref:Uncharacterized protein n=1 Tax=Dermatophagoides pteronyssinus TaxID=6956 RepID=A0ABQ8JSL0_DERPT|nr:hypothetical protein DERP_004799 [Dermatophagoides pteronyssinus]
MGHRRSSRVTISTWSIKLLANSSRLSDSGNRPPIPLITISSSIGHDFLLQFGQVESIVESSINYDLIFFEISLSVYVNRVFNNLNDPINNRIGKMDKIIELFFITNISICSLNISAIFVSIKNSKLESTINNKWFDYIEN